MVLTGEKRALLGDREAAKRLTDAGVLLACAHCGKQAYISVDYECEPDSMGRKWAYTVVCGTCCATSGLCFFARNGSPRLERPRADSERGGIAETGGAERWEGRLNLARIVEERPKSDGLDGRRMRWIRRKQKRVQLNISARIATITMSSERTSGSKRSAKILFSAAAAEQETGQALRPPSPRRTSR